MIRARCYRAGREEQVARNHRHHAGGAELDFQDDKFTHSFTSFAFHGLGEYEAAAE